MKLGSADDLPLNGKLVFFLKSVVPPKFPRNENVEVAAADGSFRTVLSLSDGSLMLEDARTALGSLDPKTRFGVSAFGPIRARAVSSDGVPGEWLPLGTLVRLPTFKDLRCPRNAARPCTLTALNFFLVSSVSASPDFTNPVEIASDFTGTQVTVPHPVNGTLYLKLRDDPETVQTLTLPVTPTAPPAVTAVGPEPAPVFPAQTTPPATPPVATPPANAPAGKAAEPTKPDKPEKTDKPDKRAKPE